MVAAAGTSTPVDVLRPRSKVLALAYVETAHAWPGSNLVVESGGRPIPARVTPTPFFDPENARVRSRPEDDELCSEPVSGTARVPAGAGASRNSTG